jgi:hypothetical protein
MKMISKAILPPLMIAIIAATIYWWNIIHVWPPGKEGWLEEGLYMMAFHAFCAIVILPILIWSIARHWTGTTRIQKAMLLTSGVALMVLTVIAPEWIIRNTERHRPNHRVERTGVPQTVHPSAHP